MKDIRLISIDDNGVVSWDLSQMDKPIDGLEAAIQRVMICLFNTPGTIIDAGAWGGGIKSLILSRRKPSKSDTIDFVGGIIQSTFSSLNSSEPNTDDYKIIDLQVKDVEYKDRGLIIDLDIFFESGLRQQVSVNSGYI